LTPVETENPHGGYGKTISHLIIGLKTTKGSKSLKLDPTIYENIQKEKIQVRFFMDPNEKNNPKILRLVMSFTLKLIMEQ